MNLDEFKSSFNLLKKENAWGRAIILALVVVLFITINALVNQKAVVTVKPYTLTEEATLHHNKASMSLHKAWSLYVAESLGNVTPNTATFVRNSLENVLGPAIRDQAILMLDRQIDLIKRDNISFSFEPRDIIYDENSATTYVVGRHYTHTSPTDYDRTNRTYEFRWEFKNYMPLLVHIDTYEGAPKVRVR